MVSVIIPSYNESKNLAMNIPVLERYLAADFRYYEIIIVDDGSRDGTRRVAEGFAAKNRKIKIVSYGKNIGRGYAVRQGMKNSSKTNVFMMDADMASAIDLNIIRRMAEELESNDVVIASRFMEGSRITRKAHRQLMSSVYRKIVKLVLPGLQVADADSGLKAFRREAARLISNNTKSNRWSWDLEAITFARKKGLRIKEIPLEWNEKGSSAINLFIDPIEQLLGVVKTRLKYGRL